MNKDSAFVKATMVLDPTTNSVVLEFDKTEKNSYEKKQIATDTARDWLQTRPKGKGRVSGQFPFS